MSELIRRDDAINAVEMFFKDAYIEDADVHCTDMAYEINHIPTASPWRRVEDELPKSGEFGEIVLACNDVGTVRAAYLSRNGKWYAADNMDWDSWTWMPNVTHWMPMPEPPKEE